MTDTEHDGWPDEYRDPRDRPYPDLRVTIEAFDEMRDETLDAAESVAELRKILTDRRNELIRVFMHIDGKFRDAGAGCWGDWPGSFDYATAC